MSYETIKCALFDVFVTLGIASIQGWSGFAHISDINDISQLVWRHFGVLPVDLQQLAVGEEVQGFLLLLSLCSRPGYVNSRK